jgi:hypothetical protein
MRRGVAFCLLLALGGTGSSFAAPIPRRAATPVAKPLDLPPPSGMAPYHGTMDGIAFGMNGEVRFAEDRQDGVSNPDWFSFGQVGGFLFAHVSRRIDLAGQGCWERVADDFTLERAEVLVRMGRSMQAHAGIFLAPLGKTNLVHEAPTYEFAERSLVATQIVGVPHAQAGIGLRTLPRAEGGSQLLWEADLVTGYDDGVITRSPGGTRIPSGRNNYGDQNGLPALVGRVARRSASGAEIGLAAQSGPYNQTDVDGVHVDNTRWMHVIVADGTTTWRGFRLFSEAAYALIDVPSGLTAIYAEQQCGASVEAVRTLFDPMFRGLPGSRLTAGLRADAVDFDRSVPGDSRSRLSASLNLFPRAAAVTRFGWYYEIRRDRFNNGTHLAGLTFTAASYF